MVRLTGDIYNLPQNVGDTIELVGFLESILHIYPDDNIGSHCFHYIRRIVVYNTTVH